MLNKRGMILLETLLLFLICLIMVQLLVNFVVTNVKMDQIEKRGYEDEKIREFKQ